MLLTMCILYQNRRNDLFMYDIGKNCTHTSTIRYFANAGPCGGGGGGEGGMEGFCSCVRACVFETGIMLLMKGK